MKRRDAQEVGDIISQYLRAAGLETPLNEYKAIQAWPEVVGVRIAGASSVIRIYDQKLFVHVASSSLRSNLFMQRMLLVRKINERVGTEVITDIIFH